MLTPEKLNGYIQVATILLGVGEALGPKFRALIHLFHPDVTLTDEQINAVERLIQLDAERRLLERQAMGETS